LTITRLPPGTAGAGEAWTGCTSGSEQSCCKGRVCTSRLTTCLRQVRNRLQVRIRRPAKGGETAFEVEPPVHEDEEFRFIKTAAVTQRIHGGLGFGKISTCCGRFRSTASAKSASPGRHGTEVAPSRGMNMTIAEPRRMRPSLTGLCQRVDAGLRRGRRSHGGGVTIGAATSVGFGRC
jgi:hypothetical protein